LAQGGLHVPHQKSFKLHPATSRYISRSLTMRSVSVIALLAFAAYAHAEELAANDEELGANDQDDSLNEKLTADDSMDQLADMLMDKLADKLVGVGLIDNDEEDQLHEDKLGGEVEDYAADEVDDGELDEDELASVLGLRGGARLIDNDEDELGGEVEDFAADEVADDEFDEDELASVLGLRGGAAMKAMKAMAAMKAMKAMAAMKAMKAMKGMKAMKAMKKLKAYTQKRYAFQGKLAKTSTGLTKANLVKNKRGKIVSKKKLALGQKSAWIAAVQKARSELKIKGFQVIKKGTPLYNKAKALYKR